MANKQQARYIMGHTGGGKYRCPVCGGLVFENIDFDDGTFSYWCIGDRQKGETQGCGWGKDGKFEKDEDEECYNR